MVLVMFKSFSAFYAGGLRSRVRQQTTRIVLIRCLAFLSVMFVPAVGHAQQFNIENPSFEEFASGYNPNVNYRITSPDNIIAWNSVATSNGATNRIEHWRDGFLGVPAQSGRYFVELNPSVPVFLYQDICLVEGGVLDWSFWHRARSGGPRLQGVEFIVKDAANNVIQMLDSSVLPVPRIMRPGFGTRPRIMRYLLERQAFTALASSPPTLVAMAIFLTT